MKLISTLFICALAMVVCRVSLAQPADKSQPTDATPEQRDEVLSCFRQYNDAMMKGDIDGMVAEQYAPTDAHKKLARAVAEADAAVGKLKKAADAKFGEGSAAKVGKAVGDISNDDLKDAKVQMLGDQAVMTIGGGPGGGRMVKIDGKWLLIMVGPNITPEQLAEQTAGMQQRAATIGGTVEAVEAGKYATLDDLIKALS